MHTPFTRPNPLPSCRRRHPAPPRPRNPMRDAIPCQTIRVAGPPRVTTAPCTGCAAPVPLGIDRCPLCVFGPPPAAAVALTAARRSTQVRVEQRADTAPTLAERSAARLRARVAQLAATSPRMHVTINGPHADPIPPQLRAALLLPARRQEQER